MHNNERRRKGRGRRLTCGGSLAATRRFGWWLSRLRWRERWLVSVAGERRRKVAEERGSTARSLYEVFGWSLVMEMEVFKPMVTMLVAERRGGKREKKKFCWKQKMREGGWFLDVFGPKFLHLWSMKIKSIYRRWKRDTLSLLVQNLSPWFNPKASQPLAQSSNGELSVLCRKNSWSGWLV